MISMDMLHDAQQVLAPVISRTPMVSTKGIVPGCDFYLKADCLQKTGAFKLRGAYYKIATLSDEEKAPRVRPSPRSKPPAATAPTWCWCPGCTTTPTPKRCACGTSRV